MRRHLAFLFTYSPISGNSQSKTKRFYDRLSFERARHGHKKKLIVASESVQWLWSYECIGCRHLLFWEFVLRGPRNFAPKILKLTIRHACSPRCQLALDLTEQAAFTRLFFPLPFGSSPQLAQAFWLKLWLKPWLKGAGASGFHAPRFRGYLHNRRSCGLLFLFAPVVTDNGG